jgi:hypothetical protein
MRISCDMIQTFCQRNRTGTMRKIQPGRSRDYHMEVWHMEVWHMEVWGITITGCGAPESRGAGRPLSSGGECPNTGENAGAKLIAVDEEIDRVGIVDPEVHRLVGFDRQQGLPPAHALGNRIAMVENPADIVVVPR